MKKYYYIIIIVIVLIIVGIIVKNRSEKKQDKNENSLENEINIIQNSDSSEEENESSDESKSTIEATPEEIEEIKNEINAQGNSNIYQVEQEKNGRKILQIKPYIQFNVDLAGIMKQDKPEENEIEELAKKAPEDNGVWIAPNSRKEFLKMLNQNNPDNHFTLNNGYLKYNGNVENETENEKKLVKMIDSKKIYYINIAGKAYERDYISGEITEYPFEDMDPTQIIEPYINKNKTILEVTTNKSEKLTRQEILEAIVQY